MEPLVYCNGEIVPYAQAKVHVEDRGFQLADGIYEVIRVYRGKPFEAEAHLARLKRSAAFLELKVDDALNEQIMAAARELLERQQLTDATIYIQVTRGAAPRTHHFPATHPAPSVIVLCREAKPTAPSLLEKGVAAITVSDDRWAHVHIKTIGLLANALARQRAVQAGAHEAIFIRDGYVTDAASCNVFVVHDGALLTPPKSNYILHGITRQALLDVAASLGVPASEEPVSERQLRTADEVLITGTNYEVLPIVSLDEKTVGAGQPGPLFGRLIEGFRRATLGEPLHA